MCVSYKPAPLPPPSPSLSLIQSRISETFVMIISKNVFLDQNFKKKTFKLIFSAVLEEYHRQLCYVSLSFTKKLQLSPQFLALCVLCSVSSCYTKFCFDSDVWLICNLAWLQILYFQRRRQIIGPARSMNKLFSSSISYLTSIYSTNCYNKLF